MPFNPTLAKHIQNEEQISWMEETGQFLQYGLGAALVSGGVGIANTFISLGNAFGADAEEFDTEEILANKWSTNAADYYKEHKTALDAIGFVGTSLLPGTLAVKGLRAFQLGKNSKLVTGLGNDTKSGTYRKLYQDIKSGNANYRSALENRRLKLAAGGLKQQAAEVAVAEAAILLTMNQNPFINREDLSYFDSIVDNLDDAALGFAIGSSLGGAIQYAADLGGLKRLAKEVEGEAQAAGVTRVQDYTTSTGQQTLSQEVQIDGLVATLDNYNKQAGLTGLTKAQELYRQNSLADSKNSILQTLNLFTQGDLATSEKLFDLAKGKTGDDVANMLRGLETTKYVGQDLAVESIGRELPMGLDQVISNYKVKVPAGASRNDKVIAAADLLFKDTAKPQKSAHIFEAVGDRLTDSALRDFMQINTYGKTLAKEAEAISRKRSPARWNTIDNARLKLQNAANLTDEEVGTLQGIVNAAPTGRMLLKEGVAGLASDKLYAANRKLAPKLGKLIGNNPNLMGEFGVSKTVMDLNTGQLIVGDFVPTIRDLGNVEMVGTKINYADGKVRKYQDKFDYNNVTPEEASAAWYLAEKLPAKNIIVNPNTQVALADLPRLHAMARPDVKWNTDTLTVTTGGKQLSYTKEELPQIIREAKQEAVSQLVNSNPNDLSRQAIARILDTDDKFVEQVGGTGLSDDLVFRSSFIDPAKPSFTQMIYSKNGILDDHQLEGVAAARMNADRDSEQNWGLFASVAGDLVDIFPSNAVNRNPLTNVNQASDITTADTGGGILAAFQGNYVGGTAFFQQMGKAKAELDAVTSKNITQSIESTVGSLRNKGNPDAQAAVIQELSILNSSVLRSNQFRFVDEAATILAQNAGVTLPAGRNTIIAKPILDKLQDYTTKSGSLEGLDPNSLAAANINSELSVIKGDIDKLLVDKDHIFEIQSPDVGQFLRKYVKENDKTLAHERDIAGRTGHDFNLSEGWIYPSKPNLDDAKHVALVHYGDTKLMANKDKGVIVASNEAQLQAKRAQILEKFPDAKVVDPRQQDEWFKLKGEYDHQLSFQSKNMDSTLQNNGIRWDANPTIDANVINDMVGHLIKSRINVNTQALKLAYSQEFRTLEQHSRTLGALSTVAGTKNKTDAFQDITNIGLNINKNDKAEWWNTANEMTEKAFNKMYTSISGSVARAIWGDDGIAPRKYKDGKLIAGQDWEGVNKLLESYNFPKAYQNSAELADNFNLPRASLSKLVAKANGLLATTMLRMDWAQGMVNAMSTPIMLLPEMRALSKLASADRNQLLADGTSVTINGSVKEPSNMRIMMQSMKDYFTDMKNGGQIIKEYRRRGLVGNSIREMQQALDNLTLDPSAGAKAADSKLKTAAKLVLGIKWNDAMEDMVKFVAARSAERAYNTLGVKGIDKWQVVTSMVNRVHGNYTAAQRPAVFRGWMGQAVGLFQTYQFNLYQSVTRNIQDKNYGALRGMAAMQAGIFGTQSIPGFQALNNYIGERSQDNNDFYTETKSVLGETASEVVLFGAASNFTRPFLGEGISLYSRGDLTPRTPVLLPMSVGELPVVNAYSKALGTLAGAMGSISRGVDPVSAVVGAAAQNGLNRPIQGMAQLIQGERETRQGNVIWSYDDISTLTGIAKVMGVSSLDEGIAVQSYYRASSYKAARYEKLTRLGADVKDMMQSGQWDVNKYKDMLSEYQATGGRIENYSRWINSQATKAEESIIKKMRDNNNTPEGRYLQELLGSDNTNLVLDLGGDQ